MNYSNVIGYLLIQIFILQFISGLLLSGYYSPFYTIAFDSVFYIMIAYCLFPFISLNC